MIKVGVRLPARVRAGFSIIEILTVLTIAGITAAMSAGRIHAILVQQRVARAATILQGDLEAAFAIAARNRLPIRISWDASMMQMKVTDRAGSVAYRKTTFGKDDFGLSSSGVSFSASPIEVYPNGLASGTLVVTLSAEGNTRTISMSRSGIVRFIGIDK